jgi:mRNA-decapping enzyme 1B
LNNLLHSAAVNSSNHQQAMVGMQAPLKQPTLITPTMFQASNVEEKAAPAQGNLAPNHRPEPLTQNQLIQALNYLLENDPEFIQKIHEAYIKSFNRKVSL